MLKYQSRRIFKIGQAEGVLKSPNFRDMAVSGGIAMFRYYPYKPLIFYLSKKDFSINGIPTLINLRSQFIQ